MRIEHVALWVVDIDRVCAFFVRFFGAGVGPLYQNPSKGFSSRFLSFDSGTRIEVMSTTHLFPVQHARGAERMGLTHLAVKLDSAADVDRLTAEIRAAGHEVIDGPRRTGDGYYESVVLDPEGNRVELTA
jgi:lactoylglutathione lyase